jgi:uncharacterized protein (TIGR02996 family)
VVGDALWQEILRNPDDDGPRLVFADWLEQTGDPEQQARGALIQAQLALEGLATKEQRAPYEAQVRTVMKQWRRRWLRKIKFGTKWTFRRGFLDGVRISAAGFVARAKELFEHAPLARKFQFPEASNELVDLAKHADFARVVHADLTTMCVCGACPIENELPHLFASPYARNLRTLSLADCRIEDENAERLAASALLPNLVALDLAKNRITDGAARTLAAALAPHTRIDLRHNSISKEIRRQLRSQLGVRAKL